MSDHETKLHEDIGYIKATLESVARELYDPKEGVKAKVSCIDGKVDDLARKFEAQRTFVAGWAAGVSGAITVAAYLFKTFVWDRLSGKG